MALAAAKDLLLARGEKGYAHRCHGDLHLRNIAFIHGEPTLFDAVEFDDAIATGDVLYDLTFLLMDLEERRLRPAAWPFNPSMACRNTKLDIRRGGLGDVWFIPGAPQHASSLETSQVVRYCRNLLKRDRVHQVRHGGVVRPGMVAEIH